MPSLEKDSHAIIHEHIIPRVEKIERTQEEIQQSFTSMQNQMDMIANQVKATELSNQELKLSNNDLKQTVVAYGQSHSMLLAKSIESLVDTNKSISTVFAEVRSAKEQTSQVREKIDGNIKIAKLGTKEKVFVSIIGLLTAPSVISGISKTWSFIIEFF